DAAVLVRRRRFGRDAEHPGRLPPRRGRCGNARPPHGRSDEARLFRPREISRRSRERHAARLSHIQALRPIAARAHRPRPRRLAPPPPPAAASLGSIFAPAREGDNTTHFSVVDRFGNAVANTTTLNLSYGLGLVAEGTGILLNNELDDFAAKPGAPNAYGLIG